VIAFVLIVIIGCIIASLIARAVEALLRGIRFNDMAQRSGFGGFVASTGVTTDPTGFVALIAKWFIRLIALVVAFDALGPGRFGCVATASPVAGECGRGGCGSHRRWTCCQCARWVCPRATAKAALGNPDLLANIARVAVWAFAIVVAVNQIGIAPELVNTLFMATVGAVALAAGLAFGLGGRETATEIWRQWYERSRAAPKIGEAAENVRRDVEGGVRLV
jgi:small-conductance mechanosensitive channel